MRRFLYVFLFACLIAEGEGFFNRYWITPLRYLSELLFETKLFVVPVYDACILFLLFGGRSASKAGKTPMTRAIYASLIAVGLVSLWGVIRGGSAYQVQFQIHTLVMASLLALAIRRVLTQPDEYIVLGKLMVAAAVYRAIIVTLFYMLVVRAGVFEEPPIAITSHDDSVLFVVAFVATIAYALLNPSRKNIRNAVIICVIILLGIQFNNRRLAWVSLGGSLVAVYFALPASALRKQVNRILIRVAPIMLLYVVIGWGRPEGIFKPLRSLHSVSSAEIDPSTRSRDNENLGLLVTLTGNPALGTGWGHEYTEVDDSLAPKSFLQYRYLPHNSVLGLLAFSGFIGFAGTWIVFPVCSFFAARAVMRARDPKLRLLGMVTLAQVVACILQMWGDMGLIGQTTMFIMSTGFACASLLHDAEAGMLGLSQAPPARSIPARKASIGPPRRTTRPPQASGAR